MRPDQAVGDLSMSVVIPTKDRPARLANVVWHLLAQTIRVHELIVIDQSETDASRARLTRLVADAPAKRRPTLTYVWDRRINGAAAARNRGIDLASADIIVCVDDDMIPSPETLERLREHYRRDPAMGAITPVITNYAAPPLLDRLLTSLFCRGPFRDDRQPVYWHWRRRGPGLMRVRMLGSGMLSVRRAVLGSLRFDPRYRGRSIGEDIDLSWSLAARGARLAIATDARVVHDRGPRAESRHEEAIITSWGFVYRKHQPKTLANRMAFGWFVTGVFATAACSALKTWSGDPLRSACAGLQNLRRGYATSSFLAPAEPAPRG